MLKLTSKDVAALTNTSVSISELFAKLEEIKDRFQAEVAAVISEIDETKEDARGILDDAANDAENYYDEKSEKWQEGDRGQAYSEWKDELRRIHDEIEEDIEVPELELPEEPGWVSELSECNFAQFEF